MKDMERNGHGWVKEHLSAYVTGGLSPEEQERLENHVSACAPCAAELEKQKALDGELREMFADAKPAAGFEDRIIRGVREIPASRTIAFPKIYRAVASVAALLLVAVVGIIVHGSLREESRMAPNSHASSKATIEDPAAELANRLAGDAGILPGNQERSVDMDKSTPSEQPHSAAPARRLGVASGLIEREVEESDRSKSVDTLTKGKNQDRGRGYTEGFGAPGDAPQAASSYRDDRSSGEGRSGEKAQENAYFKPEEGLKRAEVVERKLQDAKGNAELAKASPKVKQEKKPADDPTEDPQIKRKIIRNGEVEFEVTKFDDALVTIIKIADENGGFVASTDSEKLSNGKVRGTIVVRVPPDKLDRLLLQLRGLGELKSQRIAAQDVTKKYTDIESQLRAARAMEERMLNIIKSGKGEIKDLIEAEKQLAVYREKIEVMEGEIRYYNNQISLSTLNITLYEKDIQTPAAATETENVRTSIETEDVEIAYAEAKKAITDEKECKGRIVSSELKRYDAGQLQAIIACEVPPDKVDQLSNRLRQLGRQVQYDRQLRQTTTDGGTGRAENLKIERKEAVFNITIYNLVNIQPQKMTTASFACKEVEESYKQILKLVGEKKGRIVNSSLNRSRPEQTTGNIQFEVKTPDKDAVLQEIRTGKEVVNLQETSNPDTRNTTDAKCGFVIQLVSLTTVVPRETVTLNLAVTDVPEAFRSALESVKSSEARIRTSQLDEQDKENATGYLDFEIVREKERDIDGVLKALGDLYGRNVSRAQDSPYVVDSKVRITISIHNADTLSPRETTSISVETSNVNAAYDGVRLLAQNGGKVVESHMAHAKDGQIIGKLVIDVPLAQGLSTQAKLRDMGLVRTFESSQNQRVPEGKLSRARFAVTVFNAKSIVGADEGLGDTLNDGLRVAMKALMLSLNIVIVGLIVLVPLALIFWIFWRLVRRNRAGSAAATTSSK